MSEGSGSFDAEAAKRAFREMKLTELLESVDAEQLEDALEEMAQRVGQVAETQASDASIQDIRAWTNRLLHVFDGLEFNGQIVGHQVRFALVWAWWVTVNRQAKAILCLYDAGLGVDAAPLMRSMLEHVLWAVLLSKDKGPLLMTVLRTTGHEHDNVINEARGGPLAVPEELLTLLDAAPPLEGEGSPIKSFRAVCRELGVGDTIGVIWRILSSLIHPTNMTALFLTQLGTSGVKITKEPALLLGVDLHELAEQGVMFSLDCLVWAGLAVDRLMADHPLRAAVQAVASEARIRDLGMAECAGHVS